MWFDSDWIYSDKQAQVFVEEEATMGEQRWTGESLSSSEWCPRAEVEELRVRLAEVEAERDGWLNGYGDLGARLAELGDERDDLRARLAEIETTASFLATERDQQIDRADAAEKERDDWHEAWKDMQDWAEQQTVKLHAAERRLREAEGALKPLNDLYMQAKHHFRHERGSTAVWRLRFIDLERAHKLLKGDSDG